MSHSRAHSGAEVDIIFERDGTGSSIEVKSSARVGPSDARGITAFRAAHPTPA